MLRRWNIEHNGTELPVSAEASSVLSVGPFNSGLGVRGKTTINQLGMADEAIFV